MVRSSIATVLLLALLSACSSLRAPSRQGLSAMEDGRCLDAIHLMEGPAAQGDGYSINNLGVIIESGCPEAGWPAAPARALEYFSAAAQRGVPIAFSNGGALVEFGFLPSGADPESAAKIYREGARYGDPNSIAGLERLGKPVPVVDRVAPDIAERRQMQLDFALLAAGIASGTLVPVNSPSVTPRVASRMVVPPTSVVNAPTCRNTTDCGVGQSCVLPAGQVSGIGMCVTPTKGGMPVIPAPRLAPVTMASCQFDTQCPQNFKCEHVNAGDMHGLCVGPANAQSFFH
jgi:hypothetical protein